MKKISHFFLTLVGNFTDTWDIFSSFVAFSQYLNFTTLQISEADYTPATDIGLLCSFNRCLYAIKIQTHLQVDFAHFCFCTFYIFIFTIEGAILTYNMPLIHASFTCSKWNMDKKLGLKFHLL